MAVSPGDIAFVFYSADGTKGFAFVAVNDIAAGETISFTDAGVRSDTGQMDPAASGPEGQIDWTAPAGGIPAGTVVTFTGGTSFDFNPSFPGSVSHGSFVTSDGDLDFGTFGDQLIAFTGPISSPTYIAAVNANESDWETSVTSNTLATSILPPGLTNGTNALSQTTEADNMYYNGPSTFATPELGLAAINDFSNWVTSDADLANSGPTSFTFCFAPGTLIATPLGETIVEALSIGDLILTETGARVPVKWIGRLTRAGAVARQACQLVRLRAGSLGPAVPHTDLIVTADHAMSIDGYMINASALINGTTIDWLPLVEHGSSFTVYHIETENHDVILANGAPAETFVDYVTRSHFDNHDEYLALYGAERIIPEMPRPRISSARLLPAELKARLGIGDPETDMSNVA